MDNAQNVKHPIITRLGEILQDSDGLFNLVKLNILFIFTTVPFIPIITFFTFGGSITAMSLCIRELVETGNLPDCGKKYFEYFKKYFRATLSSGLEIYFFSMVLMNFFYGFITNTGKNIFFIPLASLTLLTLLGYWAVMIHYFPALADNNLQDKKSVKKQAVNRAMYNFKTTLFAVGLTLVIYVVMVLFIPATVPLILTCAFSIPALAAGFAHTKPEFII